MKTNIVLVEIQEGSGEPIFAPVEAKHLIRNYYELLALTDDIKKSAIYKQGDIVFCLKSIFPDKECLVAYKCVSKDMVDYFFEQMTDEN